MTNYSKEVKSDILIAYATDLVSGEINPAILGNYTNIFRRLLISFFKEYPNPCGEVQGLMAKHGKYQLEDIVEEVFGIKDALDE